MISRLVERQRTVMWRALALVHTLRQLFPPAPHGTERREERSRCKTQQRQATNNNELPNLLRGGRKRKKTEEVSLRGKEERERERELS